LLTPRNASGSGPGYSTGGLKDLSNHSAGQGSSEESHRASYVSWTCDLADWNLFGVDPSHFSKTDPGVIGVYLQLFGIDESWRDCIGQNPLRAQLTPESLGKGHQSGLGRGIRSRVCLSDHSPTRSDDHNAPVTQFAHAGHDGLDESEMARKVDINVPPPLGGISLKERAHRHVCGVGDQDFNRTPMRRNLGDHCAGGSWVTDITWYRDASELSGKNA